MKTAVLVACILAIIASSNAQPVESGPRVVELRTTESSGTTPTTLLDVDHPASSDSGEGLKRPVRGLGFGLGGLGGGFGGLGGKFGGGLGGHGLGGGGFGHGLGGLGGLGGGFKKPFSFKGF